MKKRALQILILCLLLALFIVALIGCNEQEAKLEIEVANNADITTANSLDDVKQYLTVTFVDSKGNKQVVEDYVLKGTLTKGECTLTVVFGLTIETVKINVAEKAGMPVGPVTEGLKFVLNSDGTYEVDDIGFATDRDIVIPSTYNNKKVTGIANNAFKDCADITSVVIPEGITTIGKSAFENCSRIKNFIIANSVTCIGTSAFLGCSILENVYYGGSVADWCNIQFDSGASNPMCYAEDFYFDGKPITDTVTIPSNVECVGNYAFTHKKLVEIIVDGVQTIDSYAFSNLPELKSIVIKEGTKTINEKAFYFNTNLTSVEIPNSVQTIGPEILGRCQKLESLSSPFLGSSREVNENSHLAYFFLNYIPSSDSPYQSLKKATLTDTSVLPASAFKNAFSLEQFDFTNITEIGEKAFYGCRSLRLDTIPETVTSIGTYAFYDCTALSISVIPETVLELGTYAFNYAGITTMDVRYKGAVLPKGIFSHCSSLTNVTLPSTITEIGERAFQDCTLLSDLYFSASIVSIGSFAVSGGPEVIHYDGTKAQWEQITFMESWNGNGWGSGKVKTVICSDEVINL